MRLVVQATVIRPPAQAHGNGLSDVGCSLSVSYREPLHGPAVVGVAGFFFVHQDGNAPGLPVEQDVLHVLHARGLALDQLGRIPDVEMGLVHRSNLFVQGLRTEEQSALARCNRPGGTVIRAMTEVV